MLTTLSSPPINPYQPASECEADSSGAAVRPRWLVLFIVLNLVLVAIPVLSAAFAWISVLFDFANRPDNINGDPVTYQYQNFTLSVQIWPIVTFFLLPNLILFAIIGLSIAGQRTRSHK